MRDTPSDSLGEIARAKRRHRSARRAAATAILAKGISLIAIFVSVPVTLAYLGPELFGIWMLVGSTVALMQFADFGIGNGLQTAIARSSGQDDNGAIRSIVSSGYLCLITFGICFAITGTLLLNAVDLQNVFSLQQEDAVREGRLAFQMVIICISIAIPGSLIQKIQSGLQLGYISSTWQLVGTVAALLGLLFGVAAKVPLPYLVLIYIGMPVLATLSNTFWYLFRAKQELRPSLKLVDGLAVKNLIVAGGAFFALQTSNLLATAADSWIVGSHLGATQAGQYALTAQLFSVPSIFVGLALAPLWPAYAESLARGDSKWAVRTLATSILLSMVAVATGGVILTVFQDVIFTSWLGAAMAPRGDLALALACWRTIEMAGVASAMFLNGAGRLRAQVVMAVCFSVSSLTLKLWLIPKMGSVSLPWASITSYLVCVVLPLVGLYTSSVISAKRVPQ